MSVTYWYREYGLFCSIKTRKMFWPPDRDLMRDILNDEIQKGNVSENGTIHWPEGPFKFCDAVVHDD